MSKTNKKTESQHNQSCDDGVSRERHVSFAEKYSHEPTEEDYYQCYQAFHAHESIAVLSLPKTRFSLSQLNLNDGTYSLPDAMFTIIFSPFYSIRQGLRNRAVLGAEILALRHQLLVSQRSSPRPRLSCADRLLWVAFARRRNAARSWPLILRFQKKLRFAVNGHLWFLCEPTQWAKVLINRIIGKVDASLRTVIPWRLRI